MVKAKTVSESAFEEFCAANNITSQRIAEGTEPSPDYLVVVGGMTIHVEVKQIDEDQDFSSTHGHRTVGSHIRAKINQARNQLRSAPGDGCPAILLIYNNLDPMQVFGSEPHDFLAAMYGELTARVSRQPLSVDSTFHGRNGLLREGKNESFSAVGRMYIAPNGVHVHLYENVYAKVPLNYSALPPSITFNRVEVGVGGA